MDCPIDQLEIRSAETCSGIENVVNEISALIEVTWKSRLSENPDILIYNRNIVFCYKPNEENGGVDGTRTHYLHVAKETGLSFDEVWDMTGMKDWIDFMDED